MPAWWRWIDDTITDAAARLWWAIHLRWAAAVQAVRRWAALLGMVTMETTQAPPPNYAPRMAGYYASPPPAGLQVPSAALWSFATAMVMAVIGVLLAGASGWFSRVNDQAYDTPGQIRELQSGLASLRDQVREQRTGTEQQIGALRDALAASNIRMAEVTTKQDALAAQTQAAMNTLTQQLGQVNRSVQELRASFERSQGRTSSVPSLPEEELWRPQAYERPATWPRDRKIFRWYAGFWPHWDLAAR